MQTRLMRTFAVMGLLLLSACASVKNSGVIADPLEPMNRVVFSFNDALDKAIIAPMARAYKAVVPQPVRNSVQSFMRNIKTPITLANNLLQGNFEDAGRTTARFMMNTVLGVGGLNDFAATQGLEYEAADFGQTLASWGVESGPYLVLPVIGPSTFRETAGLVTDTLADPVRIVANNSEEEWVYYTKTALLGIDTRSNLLDFTDDMRKNNLDYYTATKTSYIQNRMKMLYDTHASKHNKESSAPSYDDFE